ncbi:MAG: prephenate dehydrogenase/arogenate dehydrogenase family protein [Solirubrobacterales bacterium]|nr:prephenate dehydrogenase/arogenate dehydrogenase family protein [Solirubrobacterales bacterium]MBV9801063.1 prephenate dehydrogenase/arogenate dehydrogenase family protein [Solirubrobacterales bacterium]
MAGAGLGDVEGMRIGVAGVGLLGGSIALAVRERLGATVCGYDTSREALQDAIDRGVIDRVGGSIGEAARDAQAVFVAVPVGALAVVIGEALSAASTECVVTDVGSTKRAIVAAHDDPRFVGGHPLAGAETAGVRYARADLFDGATWFLTPAATTSGILYERLHRLLRGIGARPTAIEPETHDTILATVSHLPHVLANVLVSQAARALAAGDERLPATGPSFRDATRVAGAPGEVWTDIYLSNADALTAEIDRTVARLGEVRDALARGDRARIGAWNEEAAADRRRLLEAQLAGGPVFELRASVPNRPGVIAQLALELGRSGVNITDMALYPAPDMSEGVVALWIAGEAPARRAEELVVRLGFPVARA